MSLKRADFYLLQETSTAEGSADKAKYLFACRLLEKAYLRGHQVFVYCNTRQEAETLDELLWSFQDNSFIPHNLQGEGPTKPPPIQIGCGPEGPDPRGFSEILLNLSDTIPAWGKRFGRIMELVSPTEEAKEISRLHYREYRAQGYALNTHTQEPSRLANGTPV